MTIELDNELEKKIEKLEKGIKNVLKAHETRKEVRLDNEKLYYALKFSIECLLDNKVSEGRKKD